MMYLCIITWTAFCGHEELLCFLGCIYTACAHEPKPFCCVSGPGIMRIVVWGGSFVTQLPRNVKLLASLRSPYTARKPSGPRTANEI